VSIRLPLKMAEEDHPRRSAAVNLPPILTAVRRTDPLREAFARRSNGPPSTSDVGLPAVKSRCSAILVFEVYFEVTNPIQRAPTRHNNNAELIDFNPSSF
jgi:hypothetical protein